MPMSLKENQPSTTRNRLIMVAKTGRLMHKSASPTPRAGGDPSAGFMAGSHGGRGERRGGRTGPWIPRRRPRLDRHGGAVRQTALAGDDDFLAGFHPVENLLEPVANSPGEHGATARDVVLDDEELGDAGEIHDRFERHHA